LKKFDNVSRRTVNVGDCETTV